MRWVGKSVTRKLCQPTGRLIRLRYPDAEFTQCRLHCAEPTKAWHTNTLERVTTILNNMKSDPTPDRISTLNIFERALIKFVMPCMTIIRLGPVRCKGNYATLKEIVKESISGKIIITNIQKYPYYLPANRTWQILAVRFLATFQLLCCIECHCTYTQPIMGNRVNQHTREYWIIVEKDGYSKHIQKRGGVIRMLFATEAFGLDVKISDIRRVVIWLVCKNIHILLVSCRFISLSP